MCAVYVCSHVQSSWGWHTACGVVIDRVSSFWLAAIAGFRAKVEHFSGTPSFVCQCLRVRGFPR